MQAPARLAFLCLALFVAANGQQPTPPAPAPSPAPSATPPDTDIFVVELKTAAGGKPELGTPANVTRHAGYDNQPSFLPDGQSLFFTSQREGAQTDIYRHDFRTGAAVRVTSTPESEYSPTLMPGGKFFSVVRVEADRTQRLWKFPAAGGEASLVIPSVKPVGYHLWIDERNVALFVLGAENRPHTLQFATLGKAGEVLELSTLGISIGRSMQRVPGRRDSFSFVQKLAPDNWVIKVVDLKAHRSTVLAKTPPGSEDHVWLPDGTLLMAAGAKLYRLDPARADGWQEIADFSQAGLRNITRLALSPRADRLALVAQAAAAQ
jgi:dipeptidyl aminopeptidase/acylaminoacyl peptidase